MTHFEQDENLTGLEIAVIGMTGRFPKADNVETFWNNLVNAKESICFFTDEELKEAGNPVSVLENPQFVKAYGWLDGIEYFDATFFGYTPMDAETLDPQIRILHECALHALEDAGYDSYSFRKPIGLYAGANANFAWQAMTKMSGKEEIFGVLAAKHLSDKDFMCTRVSYKLNLNGPSVILDSACSTSLVAIHLACQGLLGGDCDMALAGAVSIGNMNKSGYIYTEGMLTSPDGHCRSFDARAKGTNFGSAVGLVVLKRLEEAVEDGDTIYAVIKGSAINNDGARKSAYTAPSIEGQAQVIRNALSMAEVNAESIGYVETHGTATALGDPVEIEGLKTAFNSDKKHFCRLGAVKSNMGHLEIAAGMAGFLKTVLCLKHELIPPNLYFQSPNPKIDFENSPFVVNTELYPWKNPDNSPLRAGVSAFGIGGTNAHIILEQWQETRETSAPDGEHLFLLSAKSDAALNQAKEELETFFRKNPGINPADAAYTLQIGRQVHQHRCMFTAADIEEAIDILASPEHKKKIGFVAEEDRPPVEFVFPEHSNLYTNAGDLFYKNEPRFKETMDRCFDILKPLMGVSPVKMLYPESKADPSPLNPALATAVTYSLAQLLKDWGIKSEAVTGSGSGQYAAAAFSGTLSLEDALSAAWKEAEPPNAFAPTDKEENYVRLDISPDPLVFWHNLGQLWLRGVAIDWSGVHGNKKRLRIPMPVYPFQRKRFWVNTTIGEDGSVNIGAASGASAGPGKSGGKSDFYVPSWKREHIAAITTPPESSASPACRLIFMDEGGIGSSLAAIFAGNGETVISVELNDSFTVGDNRTYSIDPTRPGDYNSLIKTLKENNTIPTHILHMSSLTPATGETMPETGDQKELEKGFYSLLYLVQALGKYDIASDIRLTVVSRCLADVTGSEALSPAGSMVLGALRTIPCEYPNLRCRSIDIDFSGSGSPDEESKKLRRLLAEILDDNGEPVTAYRGNHRWVPGYDPFPVPVAAPASPDSGLFKNDGVYIVLGGLGHMGLSLVKQLARRRSRSRIILAGPTPVPVKDQWQPWLDTHHPDEKTSRRIRALIELDAHGFRPQPMTADITDAQSLEHLFNEVEARFGAVDGIIHAAGHLADDPIISIRSMTRELCSNQFQTTLYGLPVLAGVMAERQWKTPPRFCLLISSLAAVLPATGHALYAASHYFMDTFAALTNRNDSDTRWLSVNWDNWQKENTPTGGATAFYGVDTLGKPISGDDGFDTLTRLPVEEDIPQLAVSLTPLSHRFQQSRFELSGAPPPSIGETIPDDRLENLLVETFREILGLERIERKLNFFKMGADPVQITRAAHRLIKRLNRYIPIDAFYEYPSIDQLTEFLKKDKKTDTVPREKLIRAGKRMTNTLRKLKEMKNA